MKWTKPSGVVVEVNDTEATNAYCISLGWKNETNKIDDGGKSHEKESEKEITKKVTKKKAKKTK